MGMAVVLLVSILVRFGLVGSLRSAYDEPLHVLLARLLSLGYHPYTQLFVSYPPLFVWSLQFPWQIWGTLSALQWVMIGYSLLGVVAVGFIAFRLSGWQAGVIAALALSLAHNYLVGSSTVMTEVPSVSMAAVAVALACAYSEKGNRLLLTASGVALTASLMLKILTPFLFGLIPLMILVRHLEQRKGLTETLRGVVIDGALWGAAVVVPVLGVLLIYDSGAMYQQVIAFRFATREALVDEWSDTPAILLNFALFDNLGLVVSGLLGIVLMLWKQWRKVWFLLWWLALATGFALIQIPLRDKHMPLLLPPLAVMAGLALADLWHRSRQGRTAAAYLSLLVAVGLTASLLWTWRAEIRGETRPPTQSYKMFLTNSPLIDYIRRFTAPNDCIVTDQPSVALFSDRLIPPNLSEPSYSALASGFLLDTELIKTTESQQCQVVAPVTLRFNGNRKRFVRWAEQHFLGSHTFEDGTTVFIGQPLSTASPTHVVDKTLGRDVKLVGYDVDQQKEDSQKVLYVTLYWKAVLPVATDYVILLRVRDSDNNTVLNGDHDPYDGLASTKSFPVGKIVRETIRLELSSTMAKGDYSVLAGLYERSSQSGVPLQTEGSDENALVIGTIQYQ